MDLDFEGIVKFRKHLAGLLGKVQRFLLWIVPVSGVLFILDIPGYAHMSIPQGQYLGVFIAFTLCSAFLAVPPTHKAARDRVPSYDLLLAALGLTVAACSLPSATTKSLSGRDFRRSKGWYWRASRSCWCLRLTGVWRGGYYRRWSQGSYCMLPMPNTPRAALPAAPWRGPRLLLNYMYVDTNALLGLPVTVTATVILAFIFFGQVLFSTGAGDFFTEFASAALARFRGGAAAVSVASSSLFGTISGSALSNVVVDGVFTINLMKKTGYKPWTAAAIEAVASTGGQIMPPVMGAACFSHRSVLSHSVP